MTRSDITMSVAGSQFELHLNGFSLDQTLRFTRAANPPN